VKQLFTICGLDIAAEIDKKAGGGVRKCITNDNVEYFEKMGHYSRVRNRLQFGTLNDF
jgi:hypothetical protein